METQRNERQDNSSTDGTAKVQRLLLGAAGVIGTIILERLDAPTWLLVITFVLFMFVAVTLRWLLADIRKKIALGSIAAVYAATVIVVMLPLLAHNTPAPPPPSIQDLADGVLAALALEMQMPSSGKILDSLVIMKNDSGVRLLRPDVYCRANYVLYPGMIVRSNMAGGDQRDSGGIWGNRGRRIPIPALNPRGDQMSDQCLLGLANITGNPTTIICADITVRADYALEVDPQNGRQKFSRFVTIKDGDRLVWTGQPIDRSGTYCEEF